MTRTTPRAGSRNLQPQTEDPTLTPEESPREGGRFTSTVSMKRDPELYPPPHKADVHPAEVDNYRAGGWEVVGDFE